MHLEIAWILSWNLTSYPVVAFSPFWLIYCVLITHYYLWVSPILK